MDYKNLLIALRFSPQKFLLLFSKVILSIFGLLLLIYLLLQLPPVQQKIKDFALQEVIKKTKNRMHIGHLRFSPFNHILLEDVYISDLRGDTLLYAQKLDAGFDLFRLLKNQLLIHSVEAADFNIRISQDSAGSAFNFQFLVDAFASDSPASDSPVRIEIDQIILKNGKLSYDMLSKPYLADSLFDVNHISIQNLEAKIRLQSIDLENLKTGITSLSFTEKSGFKLDDLHFNLQSKQKVVSLNDFAVRLPHSELKLSDAELDYTGLEIRDIFAKAAYSFRIPSGKISAGDLIYFYPPLSAFPDILSFSGELKGTFPELNIPFLELRYGENFSLLAKAGMSDVYQWEQSVFAVKIDSCLIDRIASPFVLTRIDLTGEVKGALPDLHFNLQGKSKESDWTLQGKGEYVPASGNARLEAGVDQLRYNDYSCRNVSVKASYISDSVAIDIHSEDENLPLALRGNANLNKNNQEATLHADLHGLRLDALNVLPANLGAELAGVVDIRVKGFNPEAMSASATIDSLRFSTHNGVFNDSPVTIDYTAGPNKQKHLNVRSKTLNLRGLGELSFAGVDRSIRQAFPTLFSKEVSKKKKIQLPEEDFYLVIAVRRANAVSRLLGMKTEIPDSALMIGKYHSGDSLVHFDATAFYFFSPTDTCKLHLNMSNNQNKLAVLFDVNNRSAQYNLTGNTGAEIEFIPHAKNTFPNMHIALNSGSVSLNESAFHIYPAQIDIRDKRYEIHNFALRHSTSEYLKINGVVSENRNDSLLVEINRLEIKTVLDALKYDIPLSGYASGEISFSRLTSEPHIITRNFSVNHILFNQDSIGNLSLTSGWSSVRQGLFLRAVWNNPYTQESVVSGLLLPGKDSIALSGNIQGIQLRWFDDYLAGSIDGLDGELGAKIRVDGAISKPILTGTAFLKNVKAGVAKLHTVYRVSDSIDLQADKIVFNDFTIYDENRHTGKINGFISHKQFLNLHPKLTLDFNNFSVLNNAHQTDSLFFGRLNVNGRLNVSMQNKNWLVGGNLTHGKLNLLMANIPEAAAAQRYGWITFVDGEKEEAGNTRQNPKSKETSGFSFPMKLNLTLSTHPGLNVGVILNPETGDVAQVQGNGNIALSYDLNNGNMNLQGTYTVEEGDCSLSLKNITRKNFRIRNGGKLVFRGDPMNTSFDLTAIYYLKASLTSLDPSFAEITSPGKIPVNCLLTASGSMKKMQLNYQILLPNESLEVQRKLDGLLYTDEVKIKEIAYLLALGSFMPANSGGQTAGSSGVWTSIASSSVTSQLNSLLTGVLSDNWSIGTDLYSSDGSMSKMDMDVNISTRLFDDRLVVNSTLGYHNDLNPSGQTDNFTGDFDLEYKLSPEGNVLLRFFNITNNQYYEKAKMTQGVGIVYKRQGKTFRQLFRSFKIKGKKAKSFF
ncbi:MAG: translocation/assembly module TamB domain-containing protein [Dysgonamonadaceae bacterium]|jgi:hypothetical protein|nr:translocation/assembly module TamB domain-containing protein [Dysgonamonadaceae bacterium]